MEWCNKEAALFSYKRRYLWYFRVDGVSQKETKTGRDDYMTVEGRSRKGKRWRELIKGRIYQKRYTEASVTQGAIIVNVQLLYEPLARKLRVVNVNARFVKRYTSHPLSWCY